MTKYKQKNIIFLLLFSIALFSCSKTDKPAVPESSQKKIGILIVSHGSHSEQWRNMLLSIQDSVKNEILKDKSISDVRSAFMEYTEPSIASRMKEFDKEGYTDVIIIPALLTVSSHSFDDIPHILGVKESPVETERLKAENIEIYKAKANVTITPLLDFPKILGMNVVNRLKSLSKDPANEAAVLVAYGDKDYLEQWVKMLENMKKTILNNIGIQHLEYAWCGHLVHYSSEPTKKAINKALKAKQNAIVIPVLVAVDEYFQGKIIGGAVESCADRNRVFYKPDAILPDKNVQQWLIDISHETAKKLAEN